MVHPPTGSPCHGVFFRRSPSSPGWRRYERWRPPKAGRRARERYAYRSRRSRGNRARETDLHKSAKDEGGISRYFPARRTDVDHCGKLFKKEKRSVFISALSRKVFGKLRRTGCLNLSKRQPYDISRPISRTNRRPSAIDIGHFCTRIPIASNVFPGANPAFTSAYIINDQGLGTHSASEMDTWSEMGSQSLSVASVSIDRHVRSVSTARSLSKLHSGPIGEKKVCPSYWRIWSASSTEFE